MMMIKWRKGFGIQRGFKEVTFFRRRDSRWHRMGLGRQNLMRHAVGELADRDWLVLTLVRPDAVENLKVDFV